jgi:hypothetical protein
MSAQQTTPRGRQLAGLRQYSGKKVKKVANRKGVSDDKDLKAGSDDKKLHVRKGVSDDEYALHCPSSPASVSTSSRKRLVQTVWDDIEVRLPICEMPVPVDFKSHPMYAHRVKGPMCKHCWNVLAKSEGSSNSPGVCLGCDQPLCRRHWMRFPPHAAFYKKHGIEVRQDEGHI